MDYTNEIDKGKGVRLIIVEYPYKDFTEDVFQDFKSLAKTLQAPIRVTLWHTKDGKPYWHRWERVKITVGGDSDYQNVLSYTLKILKKKKISMATKKTGTKQQLLEEFERLFSSRGIMAIGFGDNAPKIASHRITAVNYSNGKVDIIIDGQSSHPLETLRPNSIAKLLKETKAKAFKTQQ